MQKLARLLACSAVLATVALSAPGTALAAHDPHDEDGHASGRVKPDGSWTLVDTDFDRTTIGNKIFYKPGNKVVDGGMILRLTESHSGNRIGKDKYVGKAPVLLVDNAPNSTKYDIYAKDAGTGSGGDFEGWIDQGTT